MKRSSLSCNLSRFGDLAKFSGGIGYAGCRTLLHSLAACAALAPAAVWADGVEPLRGAAHDARPIVELRLRSESVDQTGMSEDAQAVTLRGRLGFETGKAWNTALLAEAELLWPWTSDYNSTVNGKLAYPVVVDPENYEVNRLQLVNSSLPGTSIVLGRQRIILDDHRFVGNVGWRQNEQTFDALRVTNKSIKGLIVDIAYVDQVNRVFGNDSPVGRYHGDNVLANVSYQTPVGKLTGFAYLLDFDEALTDSSQTFGFRFTGNRPAGPIALAYLASYAAQQERADNPLDYDVDYYALELTGTYRQYSLGAGIEVLEGDGVKAFGTPLATLHKFQGTADKFLTTPPNGMDDRYLTAAYVRKGVASLDSLSAALTWHNYESERLAIDYGSELDLEILAKWRRFTGMLKYASYDAERFATDTSKLWVQVEFVW